VGCTLGRTHCFRGDKFADPTEVLGKKSGRGAAKAKAALQFWTRFKDEWAAAAASQGLRAHAHALRKQAAAKDAEANWQDAQEEWEVAEAAAQAALRAAPLAAQWGSEALHAAQQRPAPPFEEAQAVARVNQLRKESGRACGRNSGRTFPSRAERGERDVVIPTNLQAQQLRPRVLAQREMATCTKQRGG